MTAQRVSKAVGAICAAAMVLSSPISAATAADLFIGTGSKSGVYFQVGRAICRIVERAVSELGCRPIESEGSFNNVAELANVSMDFGVV